MEMINNKNNYIVLSHKCSTMINNILTLFNKYLAKFIICNNSNNKFNQMELIQKLLEITKDLKEEKKKKAVQQEKQFQCQEKGGKIFIIV